MIKKLTIFFIILFSTSFANATIEIATYKRFINEYYGWVVVSGTTSASSGSVNYRLKDGSGNSIPGHDTQALDSSIVSGAWSGTISEIPPGGDYFIEVSLSIDPEDIDTSDSIACGPVLIVTGQSITSWFSLGDLISTPNTHIYHYFEDLYYDPDGPLEHPETRGEGSAALGNVIIGVIGKPVLVVNGSSGGTSIIYWADRGVAYDLAIDRVVDLTGVQDATAIIWEQGETDAMNSMSYSTYYTNLTEVVNQYRTDLHTSIPFLIIESGRSQQPSGTDASWNAIQEAKKDFINSNINTFLAGCSLEYPLIYDNIHWDNSVYTVVGQKVGYAYLFAVNQGFNYRGPECLSWEVVSSTQTRLRFLQHSGTDFLSIPTSGFADTGIRISTSGGSVLSISDIDEENANQLLITHASGTVADVDIGYGKNPGYTNWIHDNSTLVSGGFPIERDVTIPQKVSDSTSPSCTITTNGGDDFITSLYHADLEGSSSDNVGVISVQWTNNTTGEFGDAKGTTSWSITNLPLQSGDNSITITAYDNNLNEATDNILITVTIMESGTGSDYFVALKDRPVSLSESGIGSDSVLTGVWYVNLEEIGIGSDNTHSRGSNVIFKNVILKHIGLKQ